MPRNLQIPILKADPTHPMRISARIWGYRLLLTLSLMVLCADQLTKLWIVKNPHLPLGSYWPRGGFEIIAGFFYISHIGNPGAAWGLFAGQGVWLAALAIATLAAIYFFRHQLELRRIHLQISFGLLCGGIIGNLIDRLVYGHVVDFLDVHLPGYRWPSFNVADSAICIGITIYIIHNLIEIKAEARASNPPPEKHPDD